MRMANHKTICAYKNRPLQGGLQPKIISTKLTSGLVKSDLQFEEICYK